jgi:hypothetical protein
MKSREICKSCIWRVWLATALLGALLFTGITYAAKSTGLAAITPGQTLYTQFSLYYERNCHLTTNYRRGTLVPINTAVKFVRADFQSIEVTLPNGQNLEIRNVKKYSGEKIDGIFDRTFAAKSLDLIPFTVEEQKAIQAGEVVVGMRKAAVLAALGYPPKHKTPSLDLNHWQYWQSRFDTIIVYFNQDRVAQIVD